MADRFVIEADSSDSTSVSIADHPVFVVGSPRSGTTWVQRLLLSCPKVCGGQETHFFNAFSHILQAYDKSKTLGRHGGLQAFWSEEDIVTEVRRVWKKTVWPLIEANPSAEVLVEKTPDHAAVLPDIFRCLPDSKVIHVIRDSRAVVASLLAAASDWGHAWSPRTATDAAILWYRYTRMARNFGRKLPADRYIEVHYEDLITDGVAETARLFNFIGVNVPTEQIERAVFEQKFETQKQTHGTAIPAVIPGKPEPDNFFRKGQIDSWKNELTTLQKLTTWRYSRKLMSEMGYNWQGRIAAKR